MALPEIFENRRRGLSYALVPGSEGVPQLPLPSLFTVRFGDVMYRGLQVLKGVAADASAR